MAAFPDDQPDTHLIALYEGTVTDNVDPHGQGRVKYHLSGVADHGSGWAMPIGAPGAGENVGFFFVPKVGSNLAIFFKGGDPDHARYLAGPWGTVNGITEIPTFALFDPQDDTTPLSNAERVLISGIQTERWQIIFDDRPGKESLLIRDRHGLPDPNNEGKFIRNEIELDGFNQGIRIQAVAGLSIKSFGAIDIEATNVRINGRVVVPSPSNI